MLTNKENPRNAQGKACIVFAGHSKGTYKPTPKDIRRAELRRKLELRLEAIQSKKGCLEVWE